MRSSVNAVMPVHSTETTVTLRLLLLLLLLLPHLSDARPYVNCRPESTADKQHAISPTATACTAAVKQPLMNQLTERLDVAATVKSSTNLQVSEHA